MKSCKDKIHKKTRSTKKRLVSLEHESSNGLKVRRSEVKGLGWDHTCLLRCLHVTLNPYHISKPKKSRGKKVVTVLSLSQVGSWRLRLWLRYTQPVEEVPIHLQVVEERESASRFKRQRMVSLESRNLVRLADVAMRF